MTQSTLYVLVTCCLENGRSEILKEVVENIAKQKNFEEINKNLIVIDNASTIEGVLETLTSRFDTVYRTDRNIGYWTALRWAAQQASETHKYIYSIESDCLHHDIERLSECELLLATNPDVSMVRTQEFLIAERHLYDKNKPTPKSRVYAWQSQINRFRNEPVAFVQATENIWLSNFTPVVCGLNRLGDFTQIMNELAEMPQISEATFQGKLDERYKYVGVYDGGLFHSRLSFSNLSVVAGSRPNTHVKGYRSTQHAKIDPDGAYTVTRIK